MDSKNDLYNFLHCKVVSFTIIFIILISYCYIDFLSPFNKFINNFSFIIGAAYVFLYIISGKYTKYSKALFLFFFVLLLSTLLGKYTDLYEFFKIYLKVLGLSLYIEHGIIYYNKNTISVLYSVLWILVFINFLTICLYPNGMYRTDRYANNWFFMYDNTHIMWYFSAILVSYINNATNKNNKISTIILYVIITYCVFYCKSTNSMIAYIVFIFYYLLKKILNKLKHLNYNNYLKSYIVFNALFVFVRIQYAFSWFVVNVLGKKLTFTGRTIIWDKTINLIIQKPLLGYGYETPRVFVEKMNNIFYGHAHNTLLDICYKGGVVLLLVFLYILYVIGKNIKKCTDKKIADFISVVLLCCFMMMIFEAREEKIGLYIILTLSSCANIYNTLTSSNKKEGENSYE